MNTTSEFDSVELADDLNEIVNTVITNMDKRGASEPTPEELSELNLYYVACSRARKELHNATILKDLDGTST